MTQIGRSLAGTSQPRCSLGKLKTEQVSSSKKLAEGYDNDDLRDELGFSLADIQSARQTRAIADMARSLPLPEEIKAKLDSPRAKIFTTLGRVIDSSVGRQQLHVEKDADHGIRITTAKPEFVKAFGKLVSDVALGTQSSRTLNTSEDIENYFKSWKPSERPAKKKATFVPAGIIEGKSVASRAKAAPAPAARKAKSVTTTVLPRDFKVRHGSERLVDIRSELVRLKRSEFPNAGAVLMRVFFELAGTSFHETGQMKPLIEKLGGKGKLPYGVPQMKQMAPAITKIAKEKLDASEANKVEKALRYDAAAPFSVSELHAFIHQSGDLPIGHGVRHRSLRSDRRETCF